MAQLRNTPRSSTLSAYVPPHRRVKFNPTSQTQSFTLSAYVPPHRRVKFNPTSQTQSFTQPSNGIMKTGEFKLLITGQVRILKSLEMLSSTSYSKTEANCHEVVKRKPDMVMKHTIELEFYWINVILLLAKKYICVTQLRTIPQSSKLSAYVPPHRRVKFNPTSQTQSFTRPSNGIMKERINMSDAFKHLITRQVRILKRGEMLRKGWWTNNSKEGANCDEVVKRNDLGSGPESSRRVKKRIESEFYAACSFANSPLPSLVPLPRFLLR